MSAKQLQDPGPSRTEFAGWELACKLSSAKLNSTLDSIIRLAHWRHDPQRCLEHYAARAENVQQGLRRPVTPELSCACAGATCSWQPGVVAWASAAGSVAYPPAEDDHAPWLTRACLTRRVL